MTADNSTHYRRYLRRREELSSVIARQLAVLEQLELPRTDGPGPIEALRANAGSVANDDLRVLIMGHFNAGKSTLINALLGAKILPAKMLPTTGVINEIRHGAEDAKRIVVHPKPGRWPGGDEPFEIGINELEKYVTIDHAAKKAEQAAGTGGQSTSPFQRVEIFWPLPLLRNRIEIVDSVGLNDPDSHDRVTMEYLPHADAILYCMPCEQACTRIDLDTIALLRNMGYTSLVFVLTKFDRVQESARMNDSDEDREFMQVTTGQLEKLTDLGRAGVYFVDSLHALAAKTRGDAAMLAETGFPALEKGLEEFLVGNRFRGKLVKAMVQVRATNVDCQSLLDNRERLARTSLDELQARYERAREPLARLKQRSDLIIGRIEAGLQGLLRSVSDRAHSFLIGCPSRVEGWLEGYVSTKSISWNPLKIKSSATELAEEYLGQMKNQFQLDASGWAANDLFPWLDAEITRLFEGVGSLTRDYNLALNEVRLMLAPDLNGAQIGANQDSSAASKLGGLIYGVITHDWLNAGMVGVFGVKGLMRGLATQFAAGIILGLVSLFTPVGWVGILATVIAAGTVSAAWNLASLSAAVKKQVIESVARTLRDGAEQQRMVSNIQGEVEKQFSRLIESMRAAAAADLNLVEAEVQKALAEKKSGEQAIEQDRRRLSELSRANREVAVSIVDLAIEA